MSLSDTLTELAGTGPATRSRIDTLLDKLTGTPDFEVLSNALRNKAVSAATLTKALRKEYGRDAVKDSTVAEWRRRNLSEVTGL